jgi:hypothetical protein
MSLYLNAAGIVAILVGVTHSVLGELLIFRKLRSGHLVPANPAPPLASRNVRILWATWHLASIFGFALAGILFSLAAGSDSLRAAVLNSIVFAFAGGALLVLIGTRGRHPGWIGLLVVAGLTYIGAAA